MPLGCAGEMWQLCSDRISTANGIMRLIIFNVSFAV